MPEADAGDVDRRGHHLLRVARLLGVVRGHLEADPRPEAGEEADACQADAEHACGALDALAPLKIEAGFSACQTKPVRAATLYDDGEGEDHQDDQLADQAIPRIFATTSTWK